MLLSKKIYIMTKRINLACFSRPVIERLKMS